MLYFGGNQLVSPADERRRAEEGGTKSAAAAAAAADHLEMEVGTPSTPTAWLNAPSDTESSSMNQFSRPITVCDRISALPDEVLHHVIEGCCPDMCAVTKVAECLGIFAYLNVDTSDFITVKRFKKFFDNLLLQRSCAPLEMVCIQTSYDNSYDSLDYSDIHPWIRHAIRCNVQMLGIINYCHGKLLSTDGYPIPFTSLHLNSLFSGCPVLLHLELRRCAIKATVFCSATLKSLAITSTHKTQDDPESFWHLVIDMPNLICLDIDEIRNRNLQLRDVSSVESASVYRDKFSFGHSDVDCTILSSLENATKVDLISSVYEEVLLRDLPRCGTFSNLTSLALGEWFFIDDCYPLLYLLRRSPNIEKLSLYLVKSGAYAYNHHAKSANAAAEIDPTSEGTETALNCEKLRKIEIICPQGDRRVHIIVKILLVNICPLPEIKIEPE
uniref:FBD domain-containing protein n=1 Tax=Leersia perrieri TaxID=77586 RepID=A0A0D9X4C9_9ORYZ